MSVLDKDKDKKSKATAGLKPDNNEIDHEVPVSDDEKGHGKRDHYHDEHHFTAKGQHDDVSPDDFSIKHHFDFNKKNLTFKIAATAVFLGLAIVATLIDVFAETILSIPINGVKMNMRIFDILIVIMSISTLGLVFSELIAVIIPWIHFAMHADHHPMQIVFDMLTYVVVVFLFWAIFYILFRNSVFHLDPNKKTDAIKRWVPMAVIVPLAAAAATGFYILSLYVVSLSANGAHGHDHAHDAPAVVDMNEWAGPRHAGHGEEGHAGHDHSGDATWAAIQSFLGRFSGIVFGIQLARFTIFYIFFVIIEKRMKPVNHRYR